MLFPPFHGGSPTQTLPACPPSAWGEGTPPGSEPAFCASSQPWRKAGGVPVYGGGNGGSERSRAHSVSGSRFKARRGQEGPSFAVRSSPTPPHRGRTAVRMTCPCGVCVQENHHPPLPPSPTGVPHPPCASRRLTPPFPPLPLSLLPPADPAPKPPPPPAFPNPRLFQP